MRLNRGLRSKDPREELLEIVFHDLYQMNTDTQDATQIVTGNYILFLIENYLV